MNDCKLVMAKLRKGAIIPSKREEDAAFDLYACLEDGNETGWTIQPHTTEKIPTGLVYACSEDWALILRERGSTGTISMKIGAGVSDSGYRNELFVFLYNGLDKPMVISPAYSKTIEYPEVMCYPITKAIAQFLVLPVPKVDLEEVTIEDVRSVDSMRGLGLLGSSGK